MAAALIALLAPEAAQVINSVIAYKQAQAKAAVAGPSVDQLVAAALAQIETTDDKIVAAADAQLGEAPNAG